MKIKNKYISDNEKIVIAEYPNKQFYIHYDYIDKYNHGTCIAGGFSNLKEAEKALLKHRPNAQTVNEF